MNGSQNHLRTHFGFMSDVELLDKAHSNTLTDDARAIVEAEISKRGLTIIAPENQKQHSEIIEVPVTETQGPMQTVARYLNLLEAKIHCALLQSEGINAFLADENTVNSYNYIANAVGGVRLQVPSNQMALAQQVLAEARSGQRILSNEFLDDLPASDFRGLNTEMEPDNTYLGCIAVACLFVFIVLLFI